MDSKIIKNIEAIILDTNTLYHYENIIEFPHNKVNLSKFKSFLEDFGNNKDIFVTSATMMEVITKYRNDIGNLRKHIDFYFEKQLSLSTGVKGSPFYLSLGELKDATKLSDRDLIVFAHNILERKVKCECDQAYFLITIILIPILHTIESRLTNDFAALLIKKEWIDTCKRLMQKSLKEAYEKNSKQTQKAIFWGMLTIMFCNSITIIFDYWNQNNIEPDEDIRKAFKKYARKIKNDLCDDNNSLNLMNGLTALFNPNTQKGNHLIQIVKIALEKSLSYRKYNRVSIEHIKRIFESSFTEKTRFEKNDIIDNRILKCCNDTTYLLTFDENMQAAIQKESPNNYAFIKEFYF